MKEIIKWIYGKFFFFLFRIFPLQNKIVFSSFSGKRYADNPKYISKLCYERYPNYKQVWLKHSGYDFEVPSYINTAKWGSVKMIYEMATAKVWIDSHTKPIWISKRKKQFYIETWHGGLGMKKIEGDTQENLPKAMVKRSKHNSKMIDLLISNSTWLTGIYKRAFWYGGEIQELGYPKNDILFQKDKHGEIIEKVRNYYKIEKDTLILLYAPTFRENVKKIDYGIDLNKLYNEINKKQKCIIMYRLHPVLMKEKEIFHEIEGKIIDVTSYNDMQELIITANMLITDYSSCIFDFGMLKKPAFIFANDLEDYEKNERGFYFDITSLPFPFSSNNEDLINNIINFQEREYEEKLELYFESVGLKENGTAAEQIVKIIHDKMNN